MDHHNNTDRHTSKYLGRKLVVIVLLALCGVWLADPTASLVEAGRVLA